MTAVVRVNYVTLKGIPEGASYVERVLANISSGCSGLTKIIQCVKLSIWSLPPKKRILAY